MARPAMFSKEKNEDRHNTWTADEIIIFSVLREFNLILFKFHA